MKKDDQYAADTARLSALINKYTGIPEKRVAGFLIERSPSEMLASRNSLCTTDAQRKKLAGLFEFKNLYETMKTAEKRRDKKLYSAEIAKEYFTGYYADRNDKERFTVAFLGDKGRIIMTKEMFSGTFDNVYVHTREILKEALFCNARGCILAHNHPSGTETPSQPDINVTAQIKSVLEAADIELRDHILIAGDKAISFAEHGLINADTIFPLRQVASPVRENAGAYPEQSIRQQLEAYKKNLSQEHTSTPQKATEKPKEKEI